MALAIQFNELIRSGVVVDQAELARIGKVSRARLTQIMELSCLAPVIQEELLLLENVRTTRGIKERSVRGIARLTLWHAQLEAWQLR